MEKMIGIFICSGCEIGKCLDTEKLCSAIAEPSVKISIVHPSLCSVAGYELMQQEIKNNGLNALIIGACSPREKTEIFDFPEDIMTERVSLREQVTWGVDAEGEDLHMAASDYLQMGLKKVLITQSPVPYADSELCRDVLVIGGGITGITAALEGAKAGYIVHLVEKEAHLGGWSSILFRQSPSAQPFNMLKEPGIHAKIIELEACSAISVHTSTQIESIAGQPGNFHVSFQNGAPHEIKVGAIVAAMGWKPYDANKLPNLGYGRLNGVVTSTEFEELIKNDPKTGLPQNILFIQCAGSRDKEHLPYCSNFCCGTSLKQAKYILENNPDTSVFIIYKDIRTPGLSEGFYKEIQKDDRVFFTKGEVFNVDEVDGKLKVSVKDTLLGEDVVINVDMIVLATGMIPSSTTGLNLNYRQGKGLPDLKYDFADSHFICFPYETRRTGIYTAGALRSPMDIASCMEDAAGAMLKAIQCIESTRRGEAVHPRSGDISYPELYMDRCTDCKRCTEECPFGMYDETEKGTPLPNPSRCRRCGICLGSCPERVINFRNYSINSISAMIKAVEIPDEFEEKPRILAFICENDAYPAFDMAARKALKWSPWLRIIPVRCLGSINKVWISDALSCGYDGIMQIGCKPGDDYQCHFIHGSELTKTRGENIQETLQTMMLEPERIKTEFVEITDYYRIPEIISEYAEEIERIGPNPFKGM
jgi:quinone-modifying oxidoreductase, subunit QmoB